MLWFNFAAGNSERLQVFVAPIFDSGPSDMATVAPSWQLAVCDSVLGMHAPAAQSGPQSGAVIIASSVIVARAIRKRVLIGVTRVNLTSFKVRVAVSEVNNI